MNSSARAPQRRLDERVEPGWARLSEALFKYGGVGLALLLLWLGFLTGGFFLVLTAVLALVAAIGGWLLGSEVAHESWYSRPNARAITAVLLVGAPIVLVAVAQLVGPALIPPASTNATFDGSLAAGGQRAIVLAVDPRVEAMQVNIHVTQLATGAAVRWFIQDPAGQSRWSGRTSNVGEYSSPTIESSGGQWTITIAAEAGPTDYAIEWLGTLGASPGSSGGS